MSKIFILMSEICLWIKNKRQKSVKFVVCSTTKLNFVDTEKEFSSIKKIKQQVVGNQIRNDYDRIFKPKKQQPKNTFSQKKIKSQLKSVTQNSLSVVRPESSAVSQTAEIQNLMNMVQLLMTKVDGGPEKDTTMVLNEKSIAKKTWISQPGQEQTVTVLKSKPKAKQAWVPKYN